MIYVDFLCVFILGCVVGRYINNFHKRTTDSTARPILRAPEPRDMRPYPKKKKVKRKPIVLDDEKAFQIEQHEKRGDLFIGD